MANQLNALAAIALILVYIFGLIGLVFWLGERERIWSLLIERSALSTLRKRRRAGTSSQSEQRHGRKQGQGCAGKHHRCVQSAERADGEQCQNCQACNRVRLETEDK